MVKCSRTFTFSSTALSRVVLCAVLSKQLNLLGSLGTIKSVVYLLGC